MSAIPVAAADAREAPERIKSRPVFAPRVDVHENENEIVLVADLPGVAPEGVDITVEKNVLALRARRNDRAAEGAGRLYSEVENGDYERAFTLGGDVDGDAITARLANGALTLTVPKRAPRARRVAVDGA